MRLCALLPGALALCGPAPAPAHHSLGTVDITTPVWLKGTVVRYRPGSPHALAQIEVQDTDGRRTRWMLEGPFPGRMARIIERRGGSAESYLRPGDAIEACGFRPKPHYAVQRSYVGEKIDVAHFLHVQLIVMPGGQMESWGPYGKLDNCIRATDSPAAWREFLNRDALARDLWCTGLGPAQAPSVAPPGFVEEVNRGLDRTCR